MANGRFEAKLAKLRELRDADPAVRVREVRRALSDANNYIVAKAAQLAGDAGDAELIPELLQVYGGLFGDDAVERDPLVRAKDAIVRALRALGHREPAPFVRGLHHVQLEPVYGGVADAASRLRCACAHGLVESTLDVTATLRELVPHLVDAIPVVRVETIAAIAEIGADEGLLLVRLKACAGDAEAEVIGACFAAIVDREPDGVAFVASFLDDKDDEVKAEAAVALALSRSPHALERLRSFLRVAISPDVRAAAVSACAGSPQPAVVDLLLEIAAARDVALAERALRALGASRFRDSARERARNAARRDPGLQSAYDEAFA